MSHPSIRIATLIALALALAAGGVGATLALAAAVLALNLAAGREASAALARLLWRARWLLLLVLALNAWGTPGPVAWAAAPDWAPSAVGIELALQRGATLVAMLAAVGLLLATTPRAALVAGIAWLAAPLARFGGAPERVAARLGGTLERLAGAERALRARAAERGWRDALSSLLLEVEQDAALAEPAPPASPIAAPAAFAWAWPLGLVALAAFLARG